jgi:ankyrin repeat protein
MNITPPGGCAVQIDREVEAVREKVEHLKLGTTPKKLVDEKIKEAFKNAICKQDDAALEQLLKQNYDPNHQNGFYTPLFWAANCTGTERSVELLLQHPDIDPNIQDNDGNTALHLTVKYPGRIDEMSVLLQSEKINPYLKNKKGEIPFDAALSHHNIEGAKLLLTKMDVNRPVEENNYTLLHSVVSNRFEGNDVTSLVSELIARGANVNAATTSSGTTPLRLAIDRGTEKIVKLLVLNGATLPPFNFWSSDEDEVRAHREQYDDFAEVIQATERRRPQLLAARRAHVAATLEIFQIPQVPAQLAAEYDNFLEVQE